MLKFDRRGEESLSAFRIISILLVFLLIGCASNDANKPFIFSYEYHSIEPKHNEAVHAWLSDARMEEEIKIHRYELDGYNYMYVPTYKDVVITHLYSEGTGSLKQRFIKGTNDDEVFVKIKVNPAICCTNFIYETDDNAFGSPDS